MITEHKIFFIHNCYMNCRTYIKGDYDLRYIVYPEYGNHVELIQRNHIPIPYLSNINLADCEFSQYLFQDEREKQWLQESISRSKFYKLEKRVYGFKLLNSSIETLIQKINEKCI